MMITEKDLRWAGHVARGEIHRYNTLGVKPDKKTFFTGNGALDGRIILK
jgi:hypothetical protein